MIYAKPKTGTQISFALFLAISYALLGLSFYVLSHDATPPGYHFAIVLLLGPVACYITYKVLFRYKTIAAGNRQIEVRYPQFRIHRTYSLEEVTFWKESTVQTSASSVYRELEIGFSDGRKIQMGHREFTEYEKLVKYLAQKLSRAKK